MKLKNIFSAGKMNKDSDERLVQNGEFRDALNVKVVSSSGSDVGAVENSISNTVLTQLNFGVNPVCIGSVADDANNNIYWFVRSDNGSYIAEYDADNATSTMVLIDKRSLRLQVLNFYKTSFIEANILIDIDNDKKFLYFTDNINPPRRVEVNSAKLIDGATDSNATFTKFDVDVIQQPPLNPPTIVLGTSTTNENNIKERFLYFGYRYEYKHGEYSALSPFSKVAFLPGTFAFDFSTGLNICMVNAYSEVDITFNSGTKNVVAIDLVFKESNSQNIYVIETFDKENDNIQDNTNHTYRFTNSKVYKLLPEKELFRVYDNVPLTAKTQQLVGNRIVYSNYTENFNLIDSNGDKIPFLLTPQVTNTAVASGNAQETVKSNVDYEIGLVYLDDYGRSTTVITSKNATVNVPLSASKTQNRINLTINHLPPAFATHYRVYVKQSKGRYETITPSIFHFEKETGYTYILMNGNDKNKVKEGDFLIVKADTRGQKTSLVETQVLEIKDQDINFLAKKLDANYPGSSDPPISEQSGLYMKIKPVNYSFTTDDYERTEVTDYDDSSNGRDNPLANSQSAGAYFEGPFIYPATGSSSQVTDITVAGTYTVSNQFSRITIEIDAVGGATDTFTTTITQLDNQTSTNSSTTGQTITPGTPIAIGSTGLTVDFASATGHTLGDRWTVNARPSSFSYSRNSKAFATIRSFDKNEEEISLGTVINFTYDEYNEATQLVTHEFTSNKRYANLEEWYHESGAKATLNTNITEERIFFLRGTYGSSSSSITNNSTSDNLLMIIRSIGTQNNDFDGRCKINSTVIYLKRQSSDIPTFETRAEDKNNEVFYELPRTYPITVGYHTSTAAGDTAQTNAQPAVITLPFFNAFTWGNCIESFKIKDDFNAKFFELENRPSANLKDYKKNHRTASLTYSNVYDQTTKYNGLNEFNLSTANYKDLDDFYGDINKIVARESDIVVFQENRVSKLLLNKSVLFNADGTGNVSAVNNVLGQDVPYLGEYGITNNPFSVSLWGGRIYFVDERRRAVCRLSRDGITQISDYGMMDWFNDRLSSLTKTHTLTSYAVTVAASSYTGNAYYLDGTEKATLSLERGKTYRFLQNDSTNNGHPLKFSITQNGTHGGGVTYTTGVTYVGTPGTSGAYTQIIVDQYATTLYYYCTNHSGMGGTINIVDQLDNLPFNMIGEFDPKDRQYSLAMKRTEEEWRADEVECEIIYNDADSDGDGIVDSEDPDDDNDGTPDTTDEFPNDSTETTDTDGDGVGDNADTDDDGDGTPDTTDPFPNDPNEDTDTDGDGIGDNTDPDDDGDGVPDVYEETEGTDPKDSTDTPTDTDGDGIPDNQDSDRDGDGVDNETDAFPDDSTETTDTDGDGTGDNTDTDDDGDGVPDGTDAFPKDPDETTDSDGDGVGDNSDPDDDNDGIPDTAETDTDRDGTPDDQDTDDDNDGTLDTSDAFPLDPNETTDTDSDGIGDNADTDDDGDGVPDSTDVFPLDSTETIDTDSDGTGDNADTDDDNDGVLDVNDAFPKDATETLDTDSDGIGDNTDTDDDGDGYTDAQETQAGSDPKDSSSVPADTDGDGDPDVTDTDDDNDGVPDTQDAFPQDASETTDTDSDGIGDNTDTDDDGDGFTDTIEGQAGSDPKDSSSTPADTDGDGTIDILDPDDDNDGITDTYETQLGFDPLNPASTPVDTDSDGIPDAIDTDDDGDGTPDSSDAFPKDPSEQLDTDSDGIGDNTDTDDDNDGFTDTVETAAGTDPKSDSSVPPDTDNDGILDYLDPDDDNDGVQDASDAFPKDPNETLDTDSDGVGDNADLDDDNDGISDIYETQAGTDPKDASDTPTDTDSDGIPDVVDTDDDNDGFTDTQEANAGTNPLVQDTDGDGILDGVDSHPLDSNLPLYPDRSGHSRTTTCSPTEVYMNIPNFGNSPGLGNGHYDGTGTYKDLTMVPIASSSWTTNDGLILGNGSAMNLTGYDLTDAITFQGTGPEQYITKAAAVTQGYTIAILVHRQAYNTSWSAKSFAGSGQSINDIPDNAILFAYTNDVNSNGYPNSANSPVAFVAPFAFKEYRVKSRVNAVLRDLHNNNAAQGGDLIQSDCNSGTFGGRWFEVISNLSNTQKSFSQSPQPTLTVPQVDGYLLPVDFSATTVGGTTSSGGTRVIGSSTSGNFQTGHDGFEVSYSGNILKIGGLPGATNLQTETIKIHSYFDTLPPITFHIDNVDYGQTIPSDVTVDMSIPSGAGDLTSGCSIDANGNLTVTSMGNTTYNSSTNPATHPITGHVLPYSGVGGANYKAQFVSLDTKGDERLMFWYDTHVTARSAVGGASTSTNDYTQWGTDYELDATSPHNSYVHNNTVEMIGPAGTAIPPQSSGTCQSNNYQGPPDVIVSFVKDWTTNSSYQRTYHFGILIQKRVDNYTCYYSGANYGNVYTPQAVNADTAIFYDSEIGFGGVRKPMIVKSITINVPA